MLVSYLQTSYDVLAAEHRIKDTECFKQADQSPVDCSHQGDRIEFTDPAQLTSSDTIIVRQHLDPEKASENPKIELGIGAIIESLELKVGESSCSANELAIVGLSIDIAKSLDSCAALEPLKSDAKANIDITVTYNTVSNKSEYDLLVPAEMLLTDSWNVRVKIADAEKEAGTDYAIDKQRKTLIWLKLDELEPNTAAIVEFY